MAKKNRLALVSICAGSVLLASVVVAHEGVKNPAVMARMHAMKSIGSNMKTLGEMAKGASSFNRDAARAAAASIARHSAETPALFEANESDPKSEAKPLIWTDFDDFVTRSDALTKVAEGLSSSIATVEDLPMAMKSLGDTCQACHKTYREKR